MHGRTDIFKDAVDKMVDHSCDEETEKAMRECVLNHNEVLGVDLLNTRIFGNKIYVDVEIQVNASYTLREAHAIAESVHDVIERDFPEYVVVAIDASVGSRNSVGCITLASGGLKPGCGVNKNLKMVGDIAITGVVSWGSRVEPVLLQNIRLGLVMNMANCIRQGIMHAVF